MATRGIPRRHLARTAVALGLLALAVPATAFDVDRPEVTGAYLGEVTFEKRQVAYEGVDELLRVLADLPGGGGSAGLGISVIGSTSSGLGPSYGIAVDNTITAAADGDLAAHGNPVALDGTRLAVTASFATARDFTIGSKGAVIDTDVHTLTLSGDIDAQGLLRKDGPGILVLTGANTWSQTGNCAPVASGSGAGGSLIIDAGSPSPPLPAGSSLVCRVAGAPPNVYLDEGTLRVTTTSFDASLASAFSSFGDTVLEFDQDFDGTYAQAINGDPVVGLRRPRLTVVKRGTGTVTLNQRTFLGDGGTQVHAGTLAFGGRNGTSGGAGPGDGTVFVAAGATLDLRQARINLVTPERSYTRTGALSGDGAIVLGANNLATELPTGEHAWGGVISGTGGLRVAASREARLTFTRAQTYGGPTTILDKATLALVGAGALSASSAVSVSGRGTLDISGADAGRTIGGLNGNGRVTLGTRALTLDLASGDASFNGSISGSADVLKSGTGTQSFLGTLGHTGTLRIRQGRVRATTTGLSAQVVNDAELELVQGDDVAPPLNAYSGAISGSGRLSKTGPGIVWLRGANSYSGGTTVEEGVLLGNTASLQGDIEAAADAAAAFYQVDDGNYAGRLSGAGALLAFGPGAVTLSGDNTHTGGTVFSGTLVAARAANLGAAGGALAFAGGTLRQAGDISSRHAVFVDAAGGTLDTGAHQFVLRGSLAGPGTLRKRGSGLFDLAGAHPGFTGTLDVVAGQARLAGSTAGALVLGAASTLVVDVGPGQATRFDVDGNTVLEGGALAVHAAPGAYTKRVRHTVLQAAGGVSGSFAAAGIDDPALAVTVGYTADAVLVTVSDPAASLTGFVQEPQQGGAAQVLDGLAGGNGGAAAGTDFALLSLLTEEELPLALESLAGTSIAHVNASLAQASRAVFQVTNQRLGFLAPGLGGFTSSGAAGAAPLLAGAGLAFGLPRQGQPHGAWLQGVGGAGSLDTTSSSDTDLRLGGIVAGYDLAPSAAWTLGALFALTETTVEQALPAHRTNIDTWQIGLYSRWRGTRWTIDGNAGYSDHDFNARRTLALGPVPRTARAAFDGHTWRTRIAAGYALDAAGRVTPYLALEHLAQKTGGYTERDAGALGLVVDAHHETALTSELGLRLDLPLLADRVRDVRLGAYAAWAHEYTGDGILRAHLAGDPAALDFAIRGDHQPRDAARFGLAFGFNAGQSLRLFVGGDGQVDARQTFFSANAGLRWRW